MELSGPGSGVNPMRADPFCEELTNCSYNVSTMDGMISDGIFQANTLFESRRTDVLANGINDTWLKSRFYREAY